MSKRDNKAMKQKEPPVAYHAETTKQDAPKHGGISLLSFSLVVPLILAITYYFYFVSSTSILTSTFSSSSCCSSCPRSNIDSHVLDAFQLTRIKAITWDPDIPFATYVANRAHHPIVLANTFTKTWTHAFNITTSNLIALLNDTTLDRVYQRSSINTSTSCPSSSIFPYWHRRPMGMLPELSTPEAQVKYAMNVTTMDVYTFFQCWDENTRTRISTSCTHRDVISRDSLYYYSNPLEEDFSALRAHLPNLHWLSPTHELSKSEIMIWMGMKQIITPTHNDAYHNYYVQIKGVKRFLLFPPTSHADLHLFPALHPQHQQSQILFEHLIYNHTSGHVIVPEYYPSFDKLVAKKVKSEIKPYIVDLEPGQVLYIPPLWYHHVTSITPSISLNVWTHANESDRAESAYVDTQARMERTCLTGTLETEDSRIGNAAIYLLRFISTTLSSPSHMAPTRDLSAADIGASLDFIRDVILIPRYFPLLEQEMFPSFPHPHQNLYCHIMEQVKQIDNIDNGYNRVNHQCIDVIKQQTKLFDDLLAGKYKEETMDVAAAVDPTTPIPSTDLLSRIPSHKSSIRSIRRARAELRLADLVEYVAIWAVGPAHVATFLMDLIRC